MRVTFLAMGTENISIEYLSAYIKKNSHHKVSLAFDGAMFDDKQYFYNKFLHRIFDERKRVVELAVASKPDLIAVSVFTDNFHWAVDMAGRIKARTGAPVVFGGIYPTSVPEKAIAPDPVDMICLGEGEEAMVELLDSMEKGKIDTSIKNMWFKNNGEIIKNPLRPLLDLTKLPHPDKELFENYIPIKDCYLTVTVKGCPFQCTYCSQNFMRRFEKGLGPVLREKTTEQIIDELVVMKEKYGYEEVVLMNNTFAAYEEEALRFLKLYKEKIGLRFRVMTHPKRLSYKMAKALKDAGCFRVQIGVESMNQETRQKIMKRPETNEEVLAAFEACDNAGLSYSIDHIFGIPNDTEEDLKYALRVYSRCKKVVRITPFWLSYFPKTELVEIAQGMGLLNPDAVDNINSGNEDVYIASGSIRDKEQRKLFKIYTFLFRAVPIMHPRFVDFILKHNLQQVLKHFPKFITLSFIDLLVTPVKCDFSAIMYIKFYNFQWMKRLRALFFGDKDMEKIRKEVCEYEAGKI